MLAQKVGDSGAREVLERLDGMTTKLAIGQKIDNYIQKNGGEYADWYIGIATNPRDRLFCDHNVNEKGDAWIFRDSGSVSAARDIERHFIALGCSGGEGGGSDQTHYVYAYKMTDHTQQ